MRRCLPILLLALLLPGLQGCIISSLFGFSFQETADDDLQDVLRFLGYGKLSTCERVVEGVLEKYTCAYRLTGEGGEGSEADVEALIRLPNALAAALQIIDPVIIQVPRGFGQVRGTWTVGQAGSEQPLAVRSGLTAVETHPGGILAAEPGHELVIVEFPASAPTNELLTFELRIARPAAGAGAQPVDIKLMAAAKVSFQGKDYYPPLLPCVADFARIPSIRVPAGGGLQDLVGQILEALRNDPGVRGCRDVTYAFPVPPPTPEVCDNCLDDDGDGLVDFEDPQCCGGGSGQLALARTRFAPGKTGSKVTLGGALGKVDGFGTGASPDVQLQVRGAGQTAWCAHVPSAGFKGKKRTRRFRDRAGAVAGLQEVRLQGKKSDGSVKVGVRAKKATLATPKAGEVGVTVGVWNAGTSPSTARCVAVVKTFRPQKKGIRFP